MCVLHLKVLGVFIHLLEEVLDEVRVVVKLKAPDLIDVLLCIAFALE